MNVELMTSIEIIFKAVILYEITKQGSQTEKISQNQVLGYPNVKSPEKMWDLFWRSRMRRQNLSCREKSKRKWCLQRKSRLLLLPSQKCTEAVSWSWKNLSFGEGELDLHECSSNYCRRTWMLNHYKLQFLVTSGQDRGVGKHASPPCATTERTTTRPQNK